MQAQERQILIIYCGFGWINEQSADLPPENCSLLPVTCCGSIDENLLLQPFRDGIAGILILACPQGECHFQNGEWQCLKRVELLKKLLEANRIPPDRLSIRLGNTDGKSMSEIAKQFKSGLDKT